MIETFAILSFVIAGVIAPVGMAWIKGDGWLERLGFKDSTGASVVYMCGGVCGFVGNLMLGPRFSIFSKKNNLVKKNGYQMQRIIERKYRRDMRNELESKYFSPQVGGGNGAAYQGIRYYPTIRSSSSVALTDASRGILMNEGGDMRPFGARLDLLKP